MTDILNGVDYAWSHPGGAHLQSAGMKFACRYLSSDVKKNLSRTEADDLAAHDVWSVVVWETTANRAGAGLAAGQADARTALVQARACGIPADRPIYFAVDYDAPAAAVAAYFQGVASVLTPARTGVYGGYRVVKALLDSKTVRWAWQTVAWSAGKWDDRAVIRQLAATVKINGVSCDKDFAYAHDYGQWMPGKTPQEENVPLTQAEIVAIAKECANQTWHYEWKSPTTQKATQMGVYQVWSDQHFAELRTQINSVLTAIAALPKGAGLTPAQIADLVAAGTALTKLGGPTA